MMRSDSARLASKRALLVEPQALFAPYFVGTLEAVGLNVVATVVRPGACDVRALAPDVVVFDAAHAPAAPLQTIRSLRRAVPNAHIVVYADLADNLWEGLARSLGADIVIGPKAEERDLIAALGT